MNNYKTTEAYKAMEEWQQKEVDKHFDLFNKVGEGRTPTGRHPWKEQTVSLLLYQLNQYIQQAPKKITIEEIFNSLTEIEWAQELVSIEGGRTRIKGTKDDWYLHTRAGN